jgi:hypothetical protein
VSMNPFMMCLVHKDNRNASNAASRFSVPCGSAKRACSAAARVSVMCVHARQFCHANVVARCQEYRSAASALHLCGAMDDSMCRETPRGCSPPSGGHVDSVGHHC